MKLALDVLFGLNAGVFVGALALWLGSVNRNRGRSKEMKEMTENHGPIR